MKTTAAPWGGVGGSRSTLLFEAFAIEVLTACSSVKRAAELPKLDLGDLGYGSLDFEPSEGRSAGRWEKLIMSGWMKRVFSADITTSRF